MVNVEWRIEERTGSQEILVLREEISPGKIVEVRVLHDVDVGKYLLRIIRLIGLSSSEISLLSSISANLGLSLDYSPSDRQIYLVPSPIRHVFSSIDELNAFVKNVIESIRVLSTFLGDIRSSLEILENLLNKNWLVEYSEGKIEFARKTFYLDRLLSWVIVDISARRSLETGKVHIRFSIFSKEPKVLHAVVRKLQERGFRTYTEAVDLGFAEASVEVYSLGLTERIVDEVEKLIKELTRDGQ